MKFDSALMARLQAATQQLMKDGPLATSAAFQQAMAGTAPHSDDAGTTAGPGNATMKDLNPPPPSAAGRATHRARKAAPRREDIDGSNDSNTANATNATNASAPEADAAAPQFAMPDIAAMLEKAGIVLPEGLNGALKGGLPGGLQADFAEGMLNNLPEALRDQFKNGKLPGARQRTPPPPLPDGARFDSASFTCHAGTRGYKLYVPSTYRGEPVPLIVMLHGCTQDPDDFAAGTRMNAVAEETGCLVAYPAQTQQANSSRCWNWFSAADQQRDRGEPAIIAGIARQVMADYAIDPDRVGIAGLSAGGAMAVIVAALYPELFHAAGVHSGLPIGAANDLPSALQAMQQGATQRGRAVASPPLIVFHGDKDHTVNPKNGLDVLQHGLAAHAAGTPEVETAKASGGRRYTRSIHRAADGQVLAEHWALHGGGHAWTGGSASGSYTDPTGPDASRAMVRFFEAVAKNPAAQPR